MLGRKVALERWSAVEGFAAGEAPADLLQKELKTTKNELSFWKTGTGSGEIWQDAALALASAFNRLDPLDIAWVRRDALTEEGVALTDSRGLTRVSDLENNHVDAVLLDGHRLAAVGSALAHAIGVDGTCHRLTRQEVVALLALAVRERRLSTANLPKEMRAEIDSYVQSAGP